MLYCIICGKRQDAVQFLHKFTANSGRLKDWEKALGCKLIGNIKSSWRICSNHFTADSYTYPSSGRLCSNAVPSSNKNQKCSNTE